MCDQLNNKGGFSSLPTPAPGMKLWYTTQYKQGLGQVFSRLDFDSNTMKLYWCYIYQIQDLWHNFGQCGMHNKVCNSNKKPLKQETEAVEQRDIWAQTSVNQESPILSLFPRATNSKNS